MPLLTLLLLQVEESPDDPTEDDRRGLVASGESGAGIVLLRSRKKETQVMEEAWLGTHFRDNEAES